MDKGLQNVDCYWECDCGNVFTEWGKKYDHAKENPTHKARKIGVEKAQEENRIDNDLSIDGPKEGQSGLHG